MLLQEFVKESAGTDVRAFVVGSQVVASMKRQSLDDDFRSNLHKGGLGEIVKLTPDERKMCVKAAKAMGLTVAGVDFMRSAILRLLNFGKSLINGLGISLGF